MNTSVIKVYDSKLGKYLRNAKVVLRWDGLTDLGTSKPVFTDSDGIAIVNHASSGEAIVYIDGQKVGKIRTPGSITVNV